MESESEAVKNDVIRQVQTQFAVSNAKHLLQAINEHCFERCLPTPGSSLSRGEETCFTQCVEKYMAGWNQVSSSYIRRMQREP
ncbi:Tim10/DDP family zinc finger-domain-containing protein [Xylaria sp. FL1777]|nr:Tim10/DDP family zinc finger-domain-containing protein [Xylaria sp. FL1777]